MSNEQEQQKVSWKEVKDFLEQTPPLKKNFNQHLEHFKVDLDKVLPPESGDDIIFLFAALSMAILQTSFIKKTIKETRESRVETVQANLGETTARLRDVIDSMYQICIFCNDDNKRLLYLDIPKNQQTSPWSILETYLAEGPDVDDLLSTAYYHLLQLLNNSSQTQDNEPQDSDNKPQTQDEKTQTQDNKPQTQDEKQPLSYIFGPYFHKKEKKLQKFINNLYSTLEKKTPKNGLIIKVDGHSSYAVIQRREDHFFVTIMQMQQGTLTELKIAIFSNEIFIYNTEEISPEDKVLIFATLLQLVG